MKIVLIKSVTKHFPTGLLYLAAVLEQAGHAVTVLDYVIERYDVERLARRIKEIDPDLAGINCFSFDIHPAFVIARTVKEVSPRVHVVMGGPHPTGLPEHVLASRFVDSVVVGEGEETVKSLAHTLGAGGSLRSVRGLVYKDGAETVYNDPRAFVDDVNTIPFPAYHLINLDKYYEFPDPHGMVTRHSRFMSILTSRGCPFSCTYCHNTFGKRFRARSPENVVGEMELLYHRYGVREFHIEDDAFNVDIGRAEKILDMMLEKGLRVTMQFPNVIRADRMTESLVRKLKKSGTFMVAIGIESASPNILRQIKKSLDLEKISEAVRLLVKHRILAWGYFMIGFLHETREEIAMTVAFACRLKLHFASFSIVVPFPGTELFEQVKERIDMESYFSARVTYSLPQIQLSDVPLSEIGEVKKKALRAFYTPWRILRIALMIHSARDVAFYWGKFKKNVLMPRFGEAQKRLAKPG